MNVVIDTNVLLSALLFKGTVAGIHRLWKCGQIIPCANREMMKEYARILGYDKFGLLPDEIAGLFDQEIFPYFRILKTSRRSLKHTPADPQDTMFVRTAIDAPAAYLITGDEHLLVLDGKYGFGIVSPAVFIKTVQPR